VGVLPEQVEPVIHAPAAEHVLGVFPWQDFVPGVHKQAPMPSHCRWSLHGVVAIFAVNPHVPDALQADDMHSFPDAGHWYTDWHCTQTPSLQ